MFFETFLGSIVNIIWAWGKGGGEERLSLYVKGARELSSL